MSESKAQGTKSITSAFIWKLCERFGVQGSQFVLQIVLARILDPEHYGVLSLMIIFVNLANVFIQHGFNTALVQNKDVTEEDYSSVFWIVLIVATVIYAVLFFSAPVISVFYKMPDLTAPFRALCLMLFPGALNSVQIAIVSRKMDFKHIFRSNITAILIAGVAGIAAAIAGWGLWALVIQTFLNVAVATAVMWFSVRWRPRLVCNAQRVKVLFSYGWKLMVSHFIDVLYQDIRSLAIGKKYNSETLGYYNRGKQFPQFIINAINSTVQSVMLPAMSKKQDEKTKIKAMMRNSISLSSYIIFPIMAGLAAVAKPLVSIILTDKWLPCVPYMQIYCFTLAFYPVHSCNLQAINAMGRSDIFLKLEIFKKALGMVLLVIALVFFRTPIAIAMTGVFSTGINIVVNALPNKKLINYSVFEQLRDFVPQFLLSLTMFGGLLCLGLLNLNSYVILICQVVIGAVFYIGMSVVLRMYPFGILLKTVKDIFSKKRS